MSESNVLANLGVKGVADTGGTADHEGFLLRADATGKIDTSWLGAVLLSPLYVTYWVDDTNGDDATGNGTAGAPYKTITKAVAVNLAGTPSEMVVILSPGVYAAPELPHAAQAEQDAIQKGWAFAHIQGNLCLVDGLLNGPWLKEQFVVVQPGQELVATNDGQVMVARDVKT